MTRIPELLQTLANAQGLVAVFVAADDDSVDAEVVFRAITGEKTNVHIQVGAGYYLANRWNDADESMLFGAERRTLTEAFNDALALITQGAKS